MIISSRVPHHFNNSTLIDYLSTRFTYLSYDQWCSRIAEGRIQCNNIQAHGDTIIKADDVISYDMPEFIEPPADLNYKIVYEDAWLLGIDKPGNLLVHHKGRSFKSNLIYHLRYEHDPAYPLAGVINRLDRETSGIVLIAKEKETLRLMNRLIVEKRLNKEYHAIVHGIPEPPSGAIDLPIGRMPDSKISYRYGIGGEKTKEAYTRYETISHVGEKYTFVLLLPQTGRTHQLRVHMAAIGNTIVGDKLYGMSDDDFSRWRDDPDSFAGTLIFPRQALHCSSVNFLHPHTKKRCEIAVPLPEDMQTFMQYS